MPARAQTGTRLWRPEERVVLRDFSDVLQVGVTGAAVYAVTRGGLTVYDPRFGEWMPPLTELDGFPSVMDLGVTSVRVPRPALGDPADESFWFGTTDAVLHYQPMLGRFDRIPVLDGVRQLMFDTMDPFRGMYVRTPTDWLFLARGSGVPVRAFDLPPIERRTMARTVEDVLQRYPAADAFQAQLQLDDGRFYRYTSAAVDGNRNAFFGTNGMGLFRYESLVARLEPLPFGLLSDGVGAVAVSESGVWVGSTGSRRSVTRYISGFTWVSGDLQQTRFTRAPGMARFRFDEVRDLAAWGGAMWAATDDGLIRFDDGRIRLIDRRTGLPATSAYALHAEGQMLWVGTARGLASVRDDGNTVAPIPSSLAGRAGLGAVTALAGEGDSLWVGGPWGLALAVSGRFVPSPVSNIDPLVQREPVVALAARDGHLVIASRDGIVWRGRNGSVTRARPLGGLGNITALAADRGGVWLGGQTGVQFFRFASGGFTVAAGAGDLPGIVSDIAVTERYVWIGTDDGLVRFQRDAVLP